MCYSDKLSSCFWAFFVILLELPKHIEQTLPKVNVSLVPLCVMQGKADKLACFLQIKRNERKMSTTSYRDAVAKTGSDKTQAQTDGLITGVETNEKKDSLARMCVLLCPSGTWSQCLLTA